MRALFHLALVLALGVLCAAPLLAASPGQPAAAMAYCDLDDLTTRYSATTIAELTGDADGVTVADSKVADAIDDAASDIETAVVARYGESLVERDLDSLRVLNAEGAYLLLRTRQPESIGDKDSSLRLDLERWDRKVDAIASGDRVLVSEAELAEDADGDGEPDARVTMVARERLFGGARQLAA